MAKINLEDLLTALDGDTPDSITDDQLGQAAGELRELIGEATDGDDPDVDLAEELVPALQRVTAEQEARAEAAQDRAERAQAIRRDAGIDPAADDEAAAAGDGDVVAEAEAVAADAAEPVAASAILDRLRAATASRTTVDEPTPADPAVIARAVGPAAGTDRDLLTLRDAASVFSRYAQHVGRKQRSSLIRLDHQYPAARTLGDDADTNTRRMAAVTDQRAVTAAGGICAPLEADYAHPICGERGRPVRDALPRFGAERGGIRFAPAPSLADVAGGVTTWTAANDAAQSPSPATKACPHIDCPTETSVSVDAIVACLTVGNFQARFNPEFWQSRLDLLMVQHDRHAEQALIATIEAASTAVTYNAGSGVNTVVDVLQAADKAVAGIKSRLRTMSGSFRMLAPDWLPNALRSALVANQNSNRLEAYAAADAAIAAWFAARNITPVWSPDADVFGAQGAGALGEFPGGDVKVTVWPEGTFTFLDGGVIDLGTEISDSVLNATNDRQAFMETFEQVAKRGCESLTITVPDTEGCVCNDVADLTP